MNVEGFSYLAGLVDGDGCFFIHFETDITNKRSLRMTPEIGIGLHIDSSWLLYEVKDEFGGNVHWHRKDARKWSMTKRKELRLLIENLLPYLRLKKERAKLILKAMDVMDRIKPPIPRSKSDILEIAKIQEKIHSLSGHKKRKRKWNYESIKKFLDSSPVYSENYKDVRREVGKRYGFKKGCTPWNKKYPDVIVKRARELRRQGAGPTEIAKKLEVPRTAVSNWIYKRGSAYREA